MGHKGIGDQDLHKLADVNFVHDPNNRRFISRGAITFGGEAASWFSTAQICVAKSSIETEYIVLSDVVKKTEFIRGILEFPRIAP